MNKKKLTKGQQYYIDLMDQFNEDLYSMSDDVANKILVDHKKDRDSFLMEIAKTMLEYTVADAVLTLTSTEKTRLTMKFNDLINDMFKNQTLSEKDIVKDTLIQRATDKYNINSYILSLGQEIKPKKPREDIIKDIINKKIDGEIYSDRIWSNKNDVSKSLKLEVNKFLNGETNLNDIQSVIKKEFNNNAYNTKRLVVSETARVMEAANEQWQKDNDVEYVMYLATLDNVTCAECGEYDGQIFKVDEKPVELPQHPFCRCTYTPLPSKDYKFTERLDNESKERIGWEDYSKWKSEEELQKMNLQLFGNNDYKLLNDKIEKGIINSNKFNTCYSEFNNVFSEGVETPIGKFKSNQNTFIHIAQRHPDMISIDEINNIKNCLASHDYIYETKDKFENTGKTFVKKW